MDASIAQKQVDKAAAAANAPDLWDKLWMKEDEAPWRAAALEQVYGRICALVPANSCIVDVGGGQGDLAARLKTVRFVKATVIDHSVVALEAAAERGVGTVFADVSHGIPTAGAGRPDIYICTEVAEHLTAEVRAIVLNQMSFQSDSALISVPNNRLGPDEELQHTIKFTAMSFKRELEQHWEHVRIEAMGPFLLAVCGQLAHKKFKLSATLPVRDEGRDLEPTLASLRAIADELVVGIDPRTKDDTWEVAEEYADKVFHLERPMGPPDGHTKEECMLCTPASTGDEVTKAIPCKQYMGENGINFAWARNQCDAQCSHEWIFMTEGHERLVSGRDFLLHLDEVMPAKARVAMVMREGTGQQWAFPWLYRNAPDIYWKRPVHNVLEFPEGTYAVMAPQVRTLHERHRERGAERAIQRRGQNRRQLMDDWHTEKNINSLFYLGQEWRELDPKRAIDRLDQFLAVSNNGVQRYQARLILAKECQRAGKNDQARQYLMGCGADDWSRTEHWVWLGDLAFNAGEFEKAYRFYGYAATTVGDAPMTMWWIDLCYYSYVPAQRLAMVCGELGRVEESLAWAQQVRELLPSDSPPEAFEEADSNIMILQEAIRDASSGRHT